MASEGPGCALGIGRTGALERVVGRGGPPGETGFRGCEPGVPGRLAD